MQTNIALDSFFNKRKYAIIATALLLMALTATSALGVVPIARAKQTQFNGPAMSGIFSSAADFLNDPTVSGIGIVTKSSCTDGADLGGGNIRMNCDSTNLPHNELSIAVDPSNPKHVVAGSNDYELFFQGNKIVERIIAGYYTSFDGGTTWINGHVNPDGFTFSGDPAIAFDTKLGLVFYGTINSNGGQGGGFSDASILLSASTDGGQTFGHPVVVALGPANTRNSVLNDKPYIAVDNNPTSPHNGRLSQTQHRSAVAAQPSVASLSSIPGTSGYAMKTSSQAQSWDLTELSMSPSRTESMPSRLQIFETNTSWYAQQMEG